ncbi:MAG: hypothetical protein Q7K57_52310 [Burkholderiaceae bacterium]|nr:hypothetical protein [Burkholderiaceae bacterium]
MIYFNDIGLFEVESLPHPINLWIKLLYFSELQIEDFSLDWLESEEFGAYLSMDSYSHICYAAGLPNFTSGMH